ncbi:hypothetical protein AAFP94_14745 [Flavobacteriaceae bacterium MJ-SS4]|uniref:hypothetical protein n=1 Tax=Gilvirhabdus luticola TaxID=3079858 RepID=UPI0032DCC3A8
MAFIFSCEAPATDGQITGDLDLPCYDEWNIHFYKINDENQCEGEMKIESIRENEKKRLENILKNTNDSCVQVEIKYYWLGIKLYTDGYIKNSSSTFFHLKHCK